jgi:hypothetical protein
VKRSACAAVSATCAASATTKRAVADEPTAEQRGDQPWASEQRRERERRQRPAGHERQPARERCERDIGEHEAGAGEAQRRRVRDPRPARRGKADRDVRRGQAGKPCAGTRGDDGSGPPEQPRIPQREHDGEHARPRPRRWADHDRQRAAPRRVNAERERGGQAAEDGQHQRGNARRGLEAGPRQRLQHAAERRGRRQRAPALRGQHGHGGGVREREKDDAGVALDRAEHQRRPQRAQQPEPAEQLRVPAPREQRRCRRDRERGRERERDRNQPVGRAGDDQRAEQPGDADGRGRERRVVAPAQPDAGSEQAGRQRARQDGASLLADPPPGDRDRQEQGEPDEHRRAAEPREDAPAQHVLDVARRPRARRRGNDRRGHGGRRRDGGNAGAGPSRGVGGLEPQHPRLERRRSGLQHCDAIVNHAGAYTPVGRQLLRLASPAGCGKPDQETETAAPTLREGGRQEACREAASKFVTGS